METPYLFRWQAYGNATVFKYLLSTTGSGIDSPTPTFFQTPSWRWKSQKSTYPRFGFKDYIFIEHNKSDTIWFRNIQMHAKSVFYVNLEKVRCVCGGVCILCICIYNVCAWVCVFSKFFQREINTCEDLQLSMVIFLGSCSGKTGGDISPNLHHSPGFYRQAFSGLFMMWLDICLLDNSNISVKLLKITVTQIFSNPITL